MSTYTISDAKTHLSRLIKQASQGEEVIIARGKTPLVKLVPVTRLSKQRCLEAMCGRMAMFEPIPEDEFRDWVL